MQILQLDIQGMPQAWLSPQEAAVHYATDSVSWTVGEVATTLRGGYNARLGRQSVLDIHPIIALSGASAVNLFDVVPSLTNAKLFRRDRMTCAYCGQMFGPQDLTREHIVPVSAGGPDSWCNTAAACRLSPPNYLLHCRVDECVSMRRRARGCFWTGKAYEYGLRVRACGWMATGRARSQT